MNGRDTVLKGGIFGWPELLHTLVKCLESNELNHMEGGMDALSKIPLSLGKDLLSKFFLTNCWIAGSCGFVSVEDQED
ncbi:hypothetical protein Vadar_010071 [Vaccinium darrowii]|uniref:Uncharacterized protein n=1 Tax=Vaccinium darrowii TaxID=229202 RepID=A0ACB7XPQ8_9ERIC|nr:hypothetical protein Vadar_010071 [Vaccinium darrowii]